MKSLYLFVFCMWGLILIGGGITAVLLGPISLTGFGSLNSLISSVIKGIIAIMLVVLWIFILTKMKQWVFTRSINE